MVNLQAEDRPAVSKAVKPADSNSKADSKVISLNKEVRSAASKVVNRDRVVDSAEVRPVDSWASLDRVDRPAVSKEEVRPADSNSKAALAAVKPADSKADRPDNRNRADKVASSANRNKEVSVAVSKEVKPADR